MSECDSELIVGLKMTDMSRFVRNKFRWPAVLVAAFFLSCSHGPSSFHQTTSNHIILGNQLNVPVKIVASNVVGDGDLTIQIENVSGQRVNSVTYWLLPMPCRQYNMGNLTIAHTDPLVPGERAFITVGHQRVDAYLNPKGASSIPCSSDAEEKPHLALRRVNFGDGSVWEIRPSPS